MTSDPAVGGNPTVLSTRDDADYGGASSDKTVTTTLDWLGRVVSYRDVWGNVTTTSYDQAGRARDVNGPAGAAHVDFDTGGRGMSTQKLDNTVVATAAYDASSASAVLTGATYGNGTSLTIGRDARGRTGSLDWRLPGGGALASDTVVRSLANRVVDESVDGHDAWLGGDNFQYDGAGRLTTAWVADPTQAWAGFDAELVVQLAGGPLESGRVIRHQHHARLFHGDPSGKGASDSRRRTCHHRPPGASHGCSGRDGGGPFRPL